MQKLNKLVLITLLSLLTSVGAYANQNEMPLRVGECALTKITAISSRLENAPNSGVSITFANRGYQVSYDMEPEVTHSRVGDRVTMCLVSIPKNCPPGDNRGKMYRVTNKRTRQSWVLPDSQHLCGGA